MTAVNVNGRRYTVNLPDDTPLLWALRDELGLTGTKFGCGMALCGACTVHVDGQAARACVTPLAAVLGVPQCGYCQAGQIMAATALLKRTKQPTDAQIDEAMSGNICRCGTYVRIREAIKQAAVQPGAAR